MTTVSNRKEKIMENKLNYEQAYNDLVEQINIIHGANQMMIKGFKDGKYTGVTALQAYEDFEFALKYIFSDILEK
ncbi:hypothetical protein CBF29_07865 [Vagococcus elongatus]|uniref:Uncharacterized protein n=2 Tax=Vagococcus elongatus TaxID=180344 RepID=A0A430AU57_9ENTE|nr:hypothetical protein CBF29_07865 [Vagococcus elongatus]